ncbi:hypothetical protein BDC45DRAFT_494888 [Circinella umbellata]|nr:hypothetical protein BDC45DRAFT_494888 [Circinella umbellata]
MTTTPPANDGHDNRERVVEDNIIDENGTTDGNDNNASTYTTSVVRGFFIQDMNNNENDNNIDVDVVDKNNNYNNNDVFTNNSNNNNDDNAWPEYFHDSIASFTGLFDFQLPTATKPQSTAMTNIDPEEDSADNSDIEKLNNKDNDRNNVR